MNLYVSLEEIKAFLGISGTSEDTRLGMLNEFATGEVNSMIGVTDLSLHQVSGEVHNGYERFYSLNDLHLVEIGSINTPNGLHTQETPYDVIRGNDGLDYMFNLSAPVYADPRTVLIDYVAGWNAYGMTKLTVSDYAAIAGAATITVGGTGGYTITRGVGAWVAGSSNEDEASKIATAINGHLAVTKAFAVGSTVYIIETTKPGVSGRTVATSDAVRLALSSSTLSGIDFPSNIKLAVILLVSGMLQAAKNPNVRSYTIGSKTVSFGTDAEFETFKAKVLPFKRAKLFVA